MKKSTLALAVYLSLVFISGLLVGGFGYRLYSTQARVSATDRDRPSPAEWRSRYVNALTRRLALTDDQIEQLNVILDQTKERFKKLDEEVLKPGKREIRAAQIADITAMLTDEQKAEYEKFREERAERHRKAHKNGEHGPPPSRR